MVRQSMSMEHLRLNNDDEIKIQTAAIDEKYKKNYEEELAKAIGLSIDEKCKKNCEEELAKAISLSIYDKINHIIENLKIERKNGNKLGLIIGRKDNEYIPTESGWIWISLDFQESKEFTSNRYHFKIDVNDKKWNSAIIENLKGFDKVVVDWSTIFVINKPVWVNLKKLLKKDKNSKLIAELLVKCITYCNDKQFNDLSENDGWRDGINVKNNCYTNKIKWCLSEEKKENQKIKFEKETIIYLKNLFEDIEIFNNKQYPTRENMNHYKISTKFLIMTNPKNKEK